MTHSAGKRNVIVFGDSITEAKELSEIERSNTWVHIVQRESHGLLHMINEGKGGRPTSALSEFTEMLKRHKQADLLILALGANDARDVSGNCLANAVGNLRAMIKLARGRYGENLKILLVAPTNINKEALGPTRPIAQERDTNLKDLGSAYSLLAQEQSCHFVSLYGSVPGTTLINDGVHPDAEGHRCIAEVMKSSIHSIVVE